MVSEIDNNRVPMIVIPTQKVADQQALAADPSSRRPKDTVVLENRREIKPRGSYEKGIFVDFYI